MYSPMVAVQTVLPETPVIIDALTMLAEVSQFGAHL